MRLAVLISTLLLAGCWSSDLPEVEPPVVPARDAVVQAVTMPDLQKIPAEVAKAAEVVQVVTKANDATGERISKIQSMTDLTRVAAYAVALGVVAFLASGVFPIPGLKANALATIAIGAAIGVVAPWLNDILGDENARTIAYVAFGIVAISAALGLAWYIIDKVKDETEHDDAPPSA